MNRFVQKIIEFLLKRTEHLDAALDKSKDPNDPMQKRMKTLLEKREMMKSAVQQAEKAKTGGGKTPDGKSVTLSGTIANSLAAKKSAITPPKKAQNAKRNNRPKRGR